MALTRTLAEIQTEVRVLTDTVNDRHISDAHLTYWINQGLAELRGILLRLDPDRHVTTTTVSTTAGTAGYNLPANFLSLRRVDLVEGTRRYPIEQFQLQEPPYWYSDFAGSGAPPYAATRYRLIGDQITFDPDPGTRTFTLYYVQVPTRLAAGGDTVDGVIGWEDWIVMFVAARVRVRNEEDPSFELAEMARIEDKIKAEAANRDSGQAPKIGDVRPRGAWPGNGWA